MHPFLSVLRRESWSSPCTLCSDSPAPTWGGWWVCEDKTSLKLIPVQTKRTFFSLSLVCREHVWASLKTLAMISFCLFFTSRVKWQSGGEGSRHRYPALMSLTPFPELEQVASNNLIVPLPSDKDDVCLTSSSIPFCDSRG